MGFYVGFRTEFFSSIWHNGINERECFLLPSKTMRRILIMLKKIAALVLSLALCLSLVSFAVAEDVPTTSISMMKSPDWAGCSTRACAWTRSASTAPTK